MPGKKKRTAVLIHGCHLQADLNGKAWEEIVLGLHNGKIGLTGRAVMGVKIALEEDAEMVIFSTGASERGRLKEGEYTYRQIRQHASEIAAILGHVEWPRLDDWLAGRVQLDLSSQNTAEECRRNFGIAADSGIERVIIVSSPWHIQRCLTEALKAKDAVRSESGVSLEILAAASEGSTEGVVVLEPPHRGDMPKVPFHKTGARLFKFLKNPDLAFELNDGLNQTIDEFEKRL